MAEETPGSSENPREGRTELGPNQKGSRWFNILLGRRPLWTFVRMVVLISIVLVVYKTALVPIRVTGVSMEPTYHNGRLNVLNKLAYNRRDPARGEVVGIQLRDRQMVLMKRIVGLPGETIEIKGGRVWVDGKALTEPYAQGFGIPSTPRATKLAQDEFFVVGDNRSVSEYGVVGRDEILGKVLF